MGFGESGRFIMIRLLLTHLMGHMAMVDMVARSRLGVGLVVSELHMLTKVKGKPVIMPIVMSSQGIDLGSLIMNTVLKGTSLTVN